MSKIFSSNCMRYIHIRLVLNTILIVIVIILILLLIILLIITLIYIPYKKIQTLLRCKRKFTTSF